MPLFQQTVKPNAFSDSYGTTEVVPWYEPQVLLDMNPKSRLKPHSTFFLRPGFFSTALDIRVLAMCADVHQREAGAFGLGFNANDALVLFRSDLEFDIVSLRAVTGQLVGFFV
jgi:hypothetical protein